MSAKIAAARLRPWTATMPRPVTARSSRVQTRRGIEFEIELDDGSIGRGDISPLPGLHIETLSQDVAAVTDVFSRIQGAELPKLGREALSNLVPTLALSDEIDRNLSTRPCASWGVTCALLDAAGAFERAPVAASATLMTDDVEDIEATLPIARAAGGTKVKVPRTLNEARDRIDLVRERLGPKVEVRIDCAQAFSSADARVLALHANAAGAAFVEEPAKSLRENFALSEVAELPIALDESLAEFFGIGPAAIDLALPPRANLVFGIKPAWLGAGRTRSLIGLARARAIPVVISSTFEPDFARAQLGKIQAAVNDLALAGLARGWEFECTPGTPVIELWR